MKLLVGLALCALSVSTLAAEIVLGGKYYYTEAHAHIDGTTQGGIEENIPTSTRLEKSGASAYASGIVYSDSISVKAYASANYPEQAPFNVSAGGGAALSFSFVAFGEGGDSIVPIGIGFNMQYLITGIDEDPSYRHPAWASSSLLITRSGNILSSTWMRICDGVTSDCSGEASALHVEFDAIPNVVYDVQLSVFTGVENSAGNSFGEISQAKSQVHFAIGPPRGSNIASTTEALMTSSEYTLLFSDGIVNAPIASVPEPTAGLLMLLGMTFLTVGSGAIRKNLSR